MIRDLRITMVAALILVALGAVVASHAQAAQFHCSVEPCTLTLTPDGAIGSKTAHHVLVAADATGTSMSSTCRRLNGQITMSTKTGSELAATNLGYESCNVAGASSEVAMNGCSYIYAASGAFTISCPVGKSIEFKVPATGCVFQFGSQGSLNGLSYTNIGSEATSTTEITVITTIKGIKGITNNKCPLAEGVIEVEYTTGNTILTAETHSGVMANVWWTS